MPLGHTTALEDRGLHMDANLCGRIDKGERLRAGFPGQAGEGPRHRVGLQRSARALVQVGVADGPRGFVGVGLAGRHWKSFCQVGISRKGAVLGLDGSQSNDQAVPVVLFEQLPSRFPTPPLGTQSRAESAPARRRAAARHGPGLESLSPSRHYLDTVFADPPLNLGKDYRNGYDDRVEQARYLDWCQAWIRECCRLVKPGGAFFLYALPVLAVEFAPILEERLEFRHWIALTMKGGLATRAAAVSGPLCPPLLHAGHPPRVPRPARAH